MPRFEKIVTPRFRARGAYMDLRSILSDDPIKEQSMSERKIVVNKQTLLDKLRENRLNHDRAYAAAMVGFREEAADKLRKRANLIENGESESLFFDDLEVPHNHSGDYALVIEMLDMDMTNEVELTSTEFRRYVQDDWGWSHDFRTTNLKYSG